MQFTILTNKEWHYKTKIKNRQDTTGVQDVAIIDELQKEK